MILSVTEGYLQGNFHMQFKQPDKHGLLLTCHLSNHRWLREVTVTKLIMDNHDNMSLSTTFTIVSKLVREFS